MSYIRTKMIYFSVSLMIIVPLFLLCLYSAHIHRNRDIEERLMRISFTAEQADNVLRNARYSMGTVIGEMSQMNPDLDIIFYSPVSEVESVWHFAADPEKLQSWLLEATGGLMLAEPFEQITRDDLFYAKPVNVDKIPAGYLAFRYNIDDIQGNYSQDILVSAIIILIVTILVLFSVRRLAHRFNHALEILSDQIQIDDEEPDTLLVYPDIQPIMERINRKNSDLRNMAQKYVNEAYKMKQLMDMTPLGIMSIDERGTVTAVNKAYAALLYPDFDKDRLIGMNIRVMAEHSRIPEVDKRIELALNGVSTSASTLEHDQKVLLIYANPIYDENNSISGALGICQDITEIERLRNELHRIDRLHVIGQMAASFAHEVRNPLTVIRGFLQLMQRNMDPAKMRNYLEMVISELDRSNEIIGNFLSLAQNRFLQKDCVNLNRIIEEIEALLYAEANHSNVELIVEKDPNLQSLLLNDKEIKQLILNLTRNGIESMTGKGGKLYIRTAQLADEITLEVQDTGHGIPKDKLDQLFDPFYTTKPNGTGLGLAVCYSIVERHHAKIEVRSEEHVGTTFTIRFCCHPEQADNGDGIDKGGE